MKIFLKSISICSKDKLNYLLSGVIISTWIGLAAFFTIYYPFSFNYQTYLVDQYKLFLAVPFLSIVLAGLLFKKKFEMHILNIAACLVVFVFLVLFSFSKYYSWGNEHFSVIGAILFISTGILLLDDVIYIKITTFFFLLLFFYQLYSGLIQWIETDPNRHVSLVIKGTMQNSGIYACYLLINIPLLYWLFCSSHSIKIPVKFHSYISIIYWTKGILFFCIVTLCCALIFKTQSRTAFLATVPLVISFFIIHQGEFLLHSIKKIPRPIFYFSSLIASSTLLYVSYHLFHLKKLSSMGRLMRIDITLQHTNDMFWFGTGLGRFSWYYPQWQAEYFATHPNPPESYFLSAGESYVVFNEHLQLFKEVGFVGFVVFIVLIYCFYKTICQGNNLLNMLKVTVTTILACGFTSYPFHVNFFLLMIAFCFGAIIKFGKNDSFLLKKRYLKNSSIPKIGIVALLILTAFSCYSSVCKYSAIKKLDYLRNSYNPDISAYESLYRVLKNDGKFLAEYGKVLSDVGTDDKKSTSMLEEGKKLFISEETINTLAKMYEKNGNYIKAADNFRWLSNYLPNQFRPKYELLKMYQNSGDTLQVRQLSKSILSMPVKFQSLEIDEIKSKVKKIQEAYNN